MEDGHLPFVNGMIALVELKLSHSKNWVFAPAVK
jgi:hypothetical protein